MRPSWHLLLGAAFVLPSLLGCGSAQPVLHDPVFTRCNGSGLRDCAELTEGVVLYADGDLDSARAKLWRGSAQNSPAELKTFAASLEELGASPSANSYTEPLIEVASLIAMQAARASPAAGKPVPALVASAAPQPSAAPGGAPLPAPAKGSPDAPSKPSRREIAVVTAETDPARLDGGVASPGTSPGKVPCGALFGAGSAFCVKAIEGPFVVTDLKMLPGCPNELFIAAGSSTSPRWALLGTSAAPLAVHGSRLVVKAGEFLFVGAQAAKPEKISTDARCSILWSGFRPYSGASDAATVPRDLGF